MEIISSFLKTVGNFSQKNLNLHNFLRNQYIEIISSSVLENNLLLTTETNLHLQSILVSSAGSDEQRQNRGSHNMQSSKRSRCARLLKREQVLSFCMFLKICLMILELAFLLHKKSKFSHEYQKAHQRNVEAVQEKYQDNIC